MYYFGSFPDSPKPSSFNGMTGQWSVPAGRNWYVMIDKDGQNWASSNPLTKNADGSVSGSPLYACEYNQAYELVFCEMNADQKLGYNGPPPGNFTPNP